MTAAADYDLIPLAEPADASLACWHAYDPASNVELHSTALQIGDRLIFVDPISLEKSALDRLLGPAAPAGIILTNANHARAAETYRQRFSVPVYAQAEAVAELGLLVDHTIAGSGSLVLGALEALPLAGGVAGEMALFFEGGGGAMIIGDALIDLPGYGFSILPPKYCANPRQLRQALHTLLAKPFTVMTLAHGQPMVTQARMRLAALLAGEAP